MYSDSYSGQVLEQSDSDKEEGKEGGDIGNWFSGKLKFRKHVDDSFRNIA
jgi:hypothetical protein